MVAQSKKGREVDGVAGGPRNLLAFYPQPGTLVGWPVRETSRSHQGSILQDCGGRYTHVDRASIRDSRRRDANEPSTTYLRGR